MKEAIKNRISRRKFLEQPIDSSVWTKLQQEVTRLNEVSGLSMELVEDASNAFSSMKKSYGMFSGVKACLVLKGNQKDPDLKEKVGYYGEEIVLYMTDLDLGTCWVAGTFDRSQFAIPEGEAMWCVVPFGYVEKLSFKEKAIRATLSKKRKPARERMTGYDEAPDWAKEAMEAVVLAPSAVNSQRPIFHYKGGVVSADVVVDEHVNLVDLGIAKKNFEFIAGGRFEIGNGASFIKEN